MKEQVYYTNWHVSLSQHSNRKFKKCSDLILICRSASSCIVVRDIVFCPQSRKSRRGHTSYHIWRRRSESAVMEMQGSIGEYCLDVEVWLAYAERLEHYFVANEVANGSKKRGILLSACGPSTYGLIRNLASSQKATDFWYMVIVEKVKPGETVAAYRSRGDSPSFVSSQTPLKRCSVTALCGE